MKVYLQIKDERILNFVKKNNILIKNLNKLFFLYLKIRFLFLFFRMCSLIIYIYHQNLKKNKNKFFLIYNQNYRNNFYL
jgi:hypothetical protein